MCCVPDPYGYVRGVEMAPEVRISIPCTVFGVMAIVFVWATSCSNMLWLLLLVPVGVSGVSVHIHFAGLLRGIACSMYTSSLKTASSIHLPQVKQFVT